MTTDQYKSHFNTIKSSWNNDYSSLDYIYILQTKNGCNKTVDNILTIREAQRQLAVEEDEIQINVYCKNVHHTDGCHFPYENGYKEFAERIFKLTNRDIYNEAYTDEIDAPMITHAYLTDQTTLYIERMLTS